MKDVAPTFPHRKTCPICQTTFETQRVRSSACVVLEREPDFRTTYESINPNHYNIYVCPNCLYAAPDTAFDKEIPDQKKEVLYRALMKLKKPEPDFGSTRTPELALRAAELAIRSAQLQQERPSVLAGLFLRAAWLCRELGKTKEELAFVEQARDLYVQSFSEERNTKMSPCTMMYLIGELYRQTGQYQEAIRWFSRAIADKGIKKEPEIERLTRQQWSEAKEGYRQAGGDSNAAFVVAKRRQYIRVAFDEDQLSWVRQTLGPQNKDVTLDDLLRALLDLLREHRLDLSGCRSVEDLRKVLHDYFPVKTAGTGN